MFAAPVLALEREMQGVRQVEPRHGAVERRRDVDSQRRAHGPRRPLELEEGLERGRDLLCATQRAPRALWAFDLPRRAGETVPFDALHGLHLDRVGAGTCAADARLGAV